MKNKLFFAVWLAAAVVIGTAAAVMVSSPSVIHASTPDGAK